MVVLAVNGGIAEHLPLTVAAPVGTVAGGKICVEGIMGDADGDGLSGPDIKGKLGNAAGRFQEDNNGLIGAGVDGDHCAGMGLPLAIEDGSVDRLIFSGRCAAGFLGGAAQAGERRFQSALKAILVPVPVALDVIV